ncbi:MAG: hypothetical protein GX574_15265 [Lentisphaerae bacterium]|nr:hypothetical protein [Lentisphaerota bacterium]OQC17599.1 MAG: hypothetical protein BWX73_00114 [Lentisphaerae bacterium ADurb.Bin082]
MKSSSRLAYSMKALAVVVAFVFSGVAVYAQEAPPLLPVQSVMSSFLVETNDEGKEVLTKSEVARPGQLIEYVSRNCNVTDGDLLEVNLIVPIPPYTCYLAGTASADQPIQPEFSIDGGSKYQPEPVKYMVKQADGTEKEEIATPDMYTHVRWPAGVMKARQEIVVKCRVQVK